MARLTVSTHNTRCDRGRLPRQRTRLRTQSSAGRDCVWVSCDGDVGTVFSGNVCGVVVAMNTDAIACFAVCGLMLAGGLVLLWITF